MPPAPPWLKPGRAPRPPGRIWAIQTQLLGKFICLVRAQGLSDDNIVFPDLTGNGLPHRVGSARSLGALRGPSYPRVQPESILGVSLLLGLLPTWVPFPRPPAPPGSPFPQVPQSRVTPSHPGPPHPGPPPLGHPLFTQAPHHQALSFLPLPLHVIATCTHRQSSCLNIHHLPTHAHTCAQGGCPWVHTRSQACARPPRLATWVCSGSGPMGTSPQEVRQGAGQPLEVPRPPAQPRPLAPTCLLPFPS